MQRIVILCFALVSVALSNTPASAHRPYYSTIAKIILPDGELGEIRLINGDGIFFTDPVRPLLIDAAGHLLARGTRAFSIAVSCDESHRCLIVDLWKDRVYELEPASFRQGALQSVVKDGEPTDEWELESGEESWGFMTRKATSMEVAIAILTFAKESWLGLVATMALSGLGAFLLVPFHLDVETRWARIAARATLFMFGSVFFLFLTALTFWFSVLAGFPFVLWLIAVTTGAGLVWIPAALVRWRCNRPREP